MPTPELVQEREFDFSPRDFECVRALIFKRAGIDLHQGKQAMVYSRLSRRLREQNHTSFDSYLRWLEGSSGAIAEQEWQEFINCLTTNLTAFFREEHHFTALAQALQAKQAGKSVRIWCCASSTGEEPYSLAMVVAETLGFHANVKILATDIDTKVLATASRGVYEVVSKGLSPTRLRMFFQKGKGTNEGKMRVKPELSRMVEFRPFNLMQPSWHLGETFDFVFCRNVMIYFNPATQRKVLEQTHRVMVPHGQLFVGHSENFSDARDLFKLKGKTIYDRV
jgi:chemotaxis protein methyltransferase CheR